MNFESLKLGFISWIKERNEESGEKIEFNDSDISIFAYSDEFKEYLSENMNIDDVSIFSKSISEILDMDIVNGNLGDGAEDSEIEGGEDDKSDYSNILTDIMKDLINDENFKSVIDTDKSGDINNEEFSNFLSGIKDFDSDGESISLDDLFQSVKKMNDGDTGFLANSAISKDTESESENITDTSDSSNSAVSDSSAPASSGAAPAAAPSSYSSPETAPEETKEKSLDDMTSEELNSELAGAKDDLSSNQELLESILDDTDPKIAGYKAAKEEAFEAYHDELDKVNKDMAKELKKYKENVDAKEKEVCEKEKEISNQKTTVSESRNNLENAKSEKENIQSILDELTSINTSDMESSKQAELNSQIQAAQERLREAEEKVEEAEEKLEEAESKLETLESEKDELETGASGLNELNEQLSKFEEKISEEYPVIRELQSAYQDASKDYSINKNRAAKTAQNAVVNSQNYINKVQTAISNVDNKQTQKEFKFLDSGQDIVDFALQFVGKDKYEMNKILKEKGYPFDMEAWCAEFVSFCEGQILGEENLPEWYTSLNRKFCPSIMDHGRRDKDGIDHALPDIRDAKPGDIVMLGEGGTGRDHAAVFKEWADDEHNKYYTVERSGDVVKVCERQVSWNEIGAIFRLADY